MSDTSQQSVTILEKLIERGVFQSRLERWINSYYREGGDTPYSREGNENGIEAAEQLIENILTKHKSRELTDAVPSIATGILALAKADSRSVSYTRLAAGRRLVGSLFGRDIDRETDLFVVYNRNLPSCGCAQVRNNGVFGPHGDLNLEAVFLHVNSHIGVYNAQVGLVSSLQSSGPQRDTTQGFCVASFNNKQGRLAGDCLSFHDSTLTYTARDLFREHVGLTDDVFMSQGVYKTGGHVRMAQNFPGVTDYIAKYIGELGQYFTDLATGIGTTHQH